MKTIFSSILFFALSASFSLAQGANLPVHLRPEADSPVIGHLPEGEFRISPADPVSLTSEEEDAGWEAISFLDNFEGFVKRADLTKDLDVSAGSPIYISRDEEKSNVLARAQENDLFEVEELAGEWAAVSFRKPVVGYVRPDADLSEPPDDVEITDDPEVAVFEDEANEPVEEPRGRAISDRSAIPTDGILRTFEGHLAPARSFFRRNPPYPYQIVDQSGNRIAYLDLGKLLITQSIENFYGHRFDFYGRAEAMEDRRDFVVRVERMYRK